ncbi:chorismate mutase [Herbaspirillum sp. Sphag1AN]|uniref:hypothetical protein n=1 Tax=unclassified Herbaspirillum TaxID=2624150 RepID=UPI0016106E78|nr:MULTISPECIES: hypothetical protein [unclassified Herbaspirillum]MBB3212322.1 chorismate mutase [Herbaspirillum sp. Sphag1AN]MBB3245580.1 chorismate mutase [Herbaspirillum sp. Sphag64]
MLISNRGAIASEPQPDPSVTLRVDLSRRILARKLLCVSSSSGLPGAIAKGSEPTDITLSECKLLDVLLKRINRLLELAPRMAKARWNNKISGETREQKEQKLAEIEQAMSAADPAERQFVRRFFQSQFHAGSMLQLTLEKDWKRIPSHFNDPPDFDVLSQTFRQRTFELLTALREARPLLARSSARQYLQLRELELTVPAVRNVVRHEMLRVLLNPGFIPTAVSNRDN